MNEIRKDACGALMKKGYHGVTASQKMGWEVDHILPVAKDGIDDVVESPTAPVGKQSDTKPTTTPGVRTGDSPSVNSTELLIME